MGRWKHRETEPEPRLRPRIGRGEVGGTRSAALPSRPGAFCPPIPAHARRSLTHQRAASGSPSPTPRGTSAARGGGNGGGSAKPGPAVVAVAAPPTTTSPARAPNTTATCARPSERCVYIRTFATGTAGRPTGPRIAASPRPTLCKAQELQLRGLGDWPHSLESGLHHEYPVAQAWGP